LQRLFSQSLLSAGFLDLLHLDPEQDDRTGLLFEQDDEAELMLILAKMGSTISTLQIIINMEAVTLIVILKIVF